MERLATLEVGVGLYVNDIEWLQAAHGAAWTAHVRDLVHEAIRMIEVRAKVERFEQQMKRWDRAT